jgi:hypothetical protein
MKTKKIKKFDFRTIKTVEDAFKKCGYDPTKLPDVSGIPEKFGAALTTAFTLMVVFEAINNGWEPDFSNQKQPRFYPWAWVLSSGFGFSGSDCDCAFSRVRVSVPAFAQIQHKRRSIFWINSPNCGRIGYWEFNSMESISKPVIEIEYKP